MSARQQPAMEFYSVTYVVDGVAHTLRRAAPFTSPDAAEAHARRFLAAKWGDRATEINITPTREPIA